MRYFIWLLVLFGTVSSSYGELIGYWPLDEGTGNKVNDSAGNFSQGTIYDATFTTGIEGSRDLIQWLLQLRSYKLPS